MVSMDAVALGDRVRVNGMTIVDGQIVLDVTTHGPDDPMARPTQEAMWTYGLEGGKLVLTSEEVGPVTRPVP